MAEVSNKNTDDDGLNEKQWILQVLSKRIGLVVAEGTRVYITK